jgi:hypothetical protein
MRKWQRFILMLFVLLFSSSLYVYAASIPERTGAVNDPAGLFTASQAEQLEGGLKGSNYELVVLTARGIEEETIQQFGNDAYTAWKLKNHQLLLLVTADPSSVHLVYDNEQIAEAVSRSEVSNNQGIIDLNYKPLAATGSPVEGIIAVSNYINALKVPLKVAPTVPTNPTGSITTPSPTPTVPITTPPAAGELPAPTQPAVPVEPTAPIGGGSMPAVQPSSQDNMPAETNPAGGYNPLSAEILSTIAGIILLGCIALFLLWRSMLISRTKKVLEDAKALHRAAEAKLNNWSMGPGMDTDKVAQQLQIDSQQLSEQLDTNRHQVSFLSKALDQREVESLYNEVQVFAQRVDLHEETAERDGDIAGAPLNDGH